MLALMFNFNLEAIQQQHFPVFNLAYMDWLHSTIQPQSAMGCNLTYINK